MIVFNLVEMLPSVHCTKTFQSTMSIYAIKIMPAVITVEYVSNPELPTDLLARAHLLHQAILVRHGVEPISYKLFKNRRTHVSYCVAHYMKILGLTTSQVTIRATWAYD